MNNTKTIIALISFILVLSIGISCKNASGTEKQEEETSTEKKSSEPAPALETADFAADMQRSGAVIVDLRFPAEFEQGHIEGAININFMDGNFQTNILQLDKTKKYYLYSKGEAHTHRAGIYMKQNGFTDVSTLKGGWEAWKENEKK